MSEFIYSKLRRGDSLRADCIEDLSGSLLNVRQTLGQELRVTFVELDVVSLMLGPT
jgi:hypothetical protein